MPFRENDFAYARRNPEEPVGIIGKPHVLDMMEWKNPILFGAAVMSHPIDDPDLLQRRPIRKILVPGEWMRRMCEPYWGDKVEAWPVGIDTELWCKSPEAEKNNDFLIYDKILWEHERKEGELLRSIRKTLQTRGYSFKEIRYGKYKEKDFHFLLKQSRAMIFLCEHETQGIAYQQALSTDLPILAWDQGGFWQDPSYYPEKVTFGPVTSIPYWSDDCGIKFKSAQEFSKTLEIFDKILKEKKFKPRDYILNYLTLRQAAQKYIWHYEQI